MDGNDGRHFGAKNKNPVGTSKGRENLDPVPMGSVGPYFGSKEILFGPYLDPMSAYLVTMLFSSTNSFFFVKKSHAWPIISIFGSQIQICRTQIRPIEFNLGLFRPNSAPMAPIWPQMVYISD